MGSLQRAFSSPHQLSSHLADCCEPQLEMLQHPMLLSPLSCQLRLEIHSQAQETPVHRGKRPQSRKEAVEFRPDVRGVGRNQGTWTLRSAAAARTSPTHTRSSRDCVSQMSPQAKRPKKRGKF